MGSTLSSNALTKQEINFLQAHTNLGEQEIRNLHAGFLRDNPTGQLDKNTFTTFYKQFYPQETANEFCTAAFEKLDKNKNGSIDFCEFLFAIAASSKKDDIDLRLSTTFDLYDTSNDGYIDTTELSQRISAMYDLASAQDRRHRPDYILSKLDANGDAKLSKDEFITGCKNDPFLRQILAPHILLK